MRYFFDNCLSPYVAAAINTLRQIHDEEYEVFHLRQKFVPDIKDHVWISALAAEGDWVIVSGDPRITRKRVERAAWLESKLTAFFLGSGWGSLPLWDHTWRFLKWWPAIVLRSRRAAPGAGFIVPLKSSTLEEVK